MKLLRNPAHGHLGRHRTQNSQRLLTSPGKSVFPGHLLCARELEDMTDLSFMLVFVCLYSIQSPSLSALCILELDFDRLSIPDLWFLTGYGQ